MRGKILLTLSAMLGLVGTALGVTPNDHAAAASCVSAGATGLTAAVVAPTGATVSGMITATGCDIGVYVGPGAHAVMISGAVITGANGPGVFVQDTLDVTVQNSTISENGVAPRLDAKGNALEAKAVELVGTQDSLVQNNRVVGNSGGGIAVNDDGPIHPSTLAPGLLGPARGNVVVGNQISDNLNACGIVVAAYNSGGGVIDNMVRDNTVTGKTGVFPPVIGAIVVATDTPGTSAIDNAVIDNTITDTFLAGVIVHSNAPGDLVSGTVVRGNVVSGDDWGLTDGPTDGSAGIVLAAPSFPSTVPPAVLTGTLVTENRIANEYYGVWQQNATDTRIGGYGLNQATIPVYPVPGQCGRGTNSARC